MLKGLLDGGKSRRLGIVIPENSNADGIAHCVILYEIRRAEQREVRRLVREELGRTRTRIEANASTALEVRSQSSEDDGRDAVIHYFAATVRSFRISSTAAIAVSSSSSLL